MSLDSGHSTLSSASWPCALRRLRPACCRRQPACYAIHGCARRWRPANAAIRAAASMPPRFFRCKLSTHKKVALCCNRRSPSTQVGARVPPRIGRHSRNTSFARRVSGGRLWCADVLRLAASTRARSCRNCPQVSRAGKRGRLATSARPRENGRCPLGCGGSAFALGVAMSNLPVLDR